MIAAERILVVMPGGIGNLVLMLPALKALRGRFPEARITLMTGEPAVERILDNEGVIDATLLLDLRAGTSIIAGLRAVRAGRSEGFDCVLVGSSTNPVRAGLITRLMGIPVRVGEDIDGKGRFYTIKVPFAAGTHETDGNNRLIEALGIDPVAELPSLTITEEESAFVDRYLGERGIGRDAVVVGMHAGSGFKGLYKRWPAERFAELIRLAREDFGAEVVLAGGKGEMDLNRRISADSGVGVVDAAGELTLRQTAALLRRCDAFVSNDSGLAHIAAAVHTPLVVLFGKTDVDRIGPRGPHVTIIRRPQASDSPTDAMLRITVPEVRDALMNALGGVR